jgi:type IV pilus assembly protein PilW
MVVIRSALRTGRRPARRSRLLARGLSLVELMVGIAVGLFVVAAASVLMTTQISENRVLLLETQLQQDLRAAADIITRELRRIGTMQTPTAAVAFAGNEAVQNPHSSVTLASSGPAADIEFSYHRRGAEVGPWRFVLQNGIIRTRTGGGFALQDLTDGNVMRVTRFEINPTVSTGIRIPCPKLCPSGGVDCWPELHVREYEVIIEAEARNDNRVRRTLRSVVRSRNDLVDFNVAGPPSRACPA